MYSVVAGACVYLCILGLVIIYKQRGSVNMEKKLKLFTTTSPPPVRQTIFQAPTFELEIFSMPPLNTFIQNTHQYKHKTFAPPPSTLKHFTSPH